MAFDPRHPITLPFPARIVGRNVVVRPYEDADADALRTAVSESRERLRPWLPWAEAHRHLDETRGFIAGCQAQILQRSNFVLGIFDAATDRLLGGTGLHPGSAAIDWSLRRFEIGYWVRTGAEGHGHVVDAVTALSAAAFRELRARRLEIRCDVRNERSWRVAERCGYALEATLRDDRLGCDGEIASTRLYARFPDSPAPPVR